jgi:hypothetical protein
VIMRAASAGASFPSSGSPPTPTAAPLLACHRWRRPRLCVRPSNSTCRFTAWRAGLVGQRREWRSSRGRLTPLRGSGGDCGRQTERPGHGLRRVRRR